MERQRTVGEYRTIDLILFALMIFIGEMAIAAGVKLFPGEPYVFSVVPVLTAIVMMRWGPWAAIHAVVGGLALCATTGGGTMQYVTYCAGNLLGLGVLVMRKLCGAEPIRRSAVKTVLFGVLTALLMQLGRALVSLAMGGGVSEMGDFFLTDVLTLLFTAVVIWIARRLDGVFEDQIKYLLRVNREKEEERESSDEG